MKYIIMCGGTYKHWETPRQLTKICGEEIVARTIRLLKENGIEDISISSNNPLFENFGVPVLKHYNPLVVNENFRDEQGDWFYAFYPTDEPTCYLFGDVVFSPEAIKTIIETETDDIQLFASMKPFANNYIKKHEEPFALKVQNTKHLWEAIKKARQLRDKHKFWRVPMVWELFTVIKDAPLQTKRDEYTTDYCVINDYTCDIDRKDDINKILMKIGGYKMVKVEALENFTLKKFDELQNIIRAGRDEYGKLFFKDVFECSQEIADYLLGDNKLKRPVVKLIEIIPEETKEEIVEETKPEVKFFEEPATELKVEFKKTKSSKKKKK